MPSTATTLRSASRLLPGGRLQSPAWTGACLVPEQLARWALS